jgi:hypothetical protein
MKTSYATDFVDDPTTSRSLEDVVKNGYVKDLVIFFPRCFVPETCPGPRYRGYFLCTDNEENRCTLTYRQAKNVVCRLGEYTFLSKRFLKQNNLTGKVLVIPGGRQIVDVCLVDGLPRAAVGVACPPDLKEGRQRMESLGVKSFLVPLTKLEYDLKNINKVTIQSCYENVVKNGTDNYVRTLKKAVEYVVTSKKNRLTVKDYLQQKKDK